MVETPSMVVFVTDRLETVGRWIFHDLSRTVFDSVTWLFSGDLEEVTLKLVSLLVVLTSLFTYAFRAPGHEPSTPLSAAMMTLGLLFWGAALLVCLGLLSGW